MFLFHIFKVAVVSLAVGSPVFAGVPPKNQQQDNADAVTDYNPNLPPRSPQSFAAHQLVRSKSRRLRGPNAQRMGVVPTNTSFNGYAALPNEEWEVEYSFVVPSKPKGNWQTYYVYGDLSFDYYSDSISKGYLYNQLAPQAMIGNCWCGNGYDKVTYKPEGAFFSSWVLQAQYFWQGQVGESCSDGCSICGDVIDGIEPGDRITSRIKYNTKKGHIKVEISSKRGKSKITIPRPFPDSNQFDSWKNFFKKAAKESPYNEVLAYSNVIIEAESDPNDVCSSLPFEVTYASVPGNPWSKGFWEKRLEQQITQCKNQVKMSGFLPASCNNDAMNIPCKSFKKNSDLCKVISGAKEACPAECSESTGTGVQVNCQVFAENPDLCETVPKAKQNCGTQCDENECTRQK